VFILFWFGFACSLIGWENGENGIVVALWFGELGN
jgi:hypothetical protein